MITINKMSVLDDEDIAKVKTEICAITGCGELAESSVRLADDISDLEAGGYEINACSKHREILEKVKHQD